MKVRIDLKTIERMLTRNCRNALAELGFDVADEAEPIACEFVYDESADCVGIEIFQREPDGSPATNAS